MASVDNRIVNMTFNNADFESRISSTIKSLQSLDKTIAEVGTKGGLQNLAAEANKFNLDGMGSAIEGVSAKFLSLATIGITALANLTNRAVDAGISIAKALAIDPIKSGFEEYELKLGSIQTIMAGSGADLETVNKKLQELNTYSDRTIYSFADMTTNIGKFTNAGVDLDTSVASIQGIANVAAVSGANAEEASRAMYNFAQALSKGYVQLVDWKSIELANMGTVEFKTQLLDAAVAAGTLTKKGEEYVTGAGTSVTATKNFNDSLTDQWLTTEALTSALGDYADETTDIGKKAFAAAQDVKTFSQLMDTTKEAVGSGWATTFEILIGNFDEAKALWTGVNSAVGEFIGKNAASRNLVLEEWKYLGGRTQLIEGLKAGFKAFGDILRPITKAFREVFPKKTSFQLLDMTIKFREFMEALIPSETTVENLGRIFKGLFNVLDIGWEILKFGIGLIKDFVQELTGVGKGGALSFLAEIGDALASLDAESIIGGLRDAFDKLGDIFKNPIPYIMGFVDTIKTAFGDLVDLFRDPFPSLQGVIDKVSDFFSGLSVKIPDVSGPLGGAIDTIKGIFGGLGDVLGNIDLPNISFGGIIDAIGGAIGEVVDKITGFFSTGGDVATAVEDAAGGIDWETVMAGVGLGMVAGLIATVNRLITNGINIDFTGGILSSISDTFGQLTGVLKTMQQDIKANIILKIAAAIGVLALAMIALSFIDAEDLGKALVAIAIGFGQLAAALGILNKINFSTTDAAKFTLMAISFGILAGGMILLAAAMKIFGTMEWEEIAKGEVALASMIVSIIAMSRLIENNAEGMIKASFAMLLMALGMGAMAKSIKKFGEMDTGVLIQGMIGLSAAMALLVTTMQLMPDDMEKKTAGLVGFSLSLNLMVFAIKQLGQMDLGELVQGGVAFAAMLTGLVVAMRAMPNNMAPKAAQLLALSGAILVMSYAMKSFAELSWSEMVRGLAGMAASLAVLIVAMNAASGGVAGAASMIVMAGAMLILAAAIRAFAALSLADFAKGLILMSVSLAVLSAVALALAATGALEALLVLGIAMAALGLGVAAIGFGIAQVAKGIAILAAIGPEGAKGLVAVMEAVGEGIPAIFTGLAKGIGEFVEVLIGFIPTFVDFGVKLILALLEGLTQVVPKLLEFITTTILAVIELIVALIPEFALAGVRIIIGILEGVAEAIPQIVHVVGDIITGFLDALAAEIPRVITSVTNLFVTMWLGVAEALGFVAATIMFGSGLAFMQGFIDGMKNLWPYVQTFWEGVPGDIIRFIGDVIMTIYSKGLDLVQGFINGYLSIIGTVISFFTNLGKSIIGWIGSLIGTIVSKGVDIVQGFINGYNSLIGTVTSFFTGLAGAIIGWIGNLLFTLWSKGSDLIGGFIEGVDNVMVGVISFFTGLGASVVSWVGDALQWLVEAGKNVIRGLWNGIFAMKDWIIGKAGEIAGWVTNPVGSVLDMFGCPSRVFIKYGKYIGEGLIIGIDSMEQPIRNASEAMASNTVDSFTVDDYAFADSVSVALKKLTEELSANTDFNPVITPVLDLTNVYAGTSEMSGLLGGNSYSTAGNIAATQQYTEDSVVGTGPSSITFEQTINSPTALSTADIYRQTRNQVALAREELSIP